MDKQNVVRRLMSFADGAGFLNISEIARATGKSRNRVPEFVAGLDYWKDGTQKKFFVDDIAQRIVDRRVRGD